MPHAPRQAKPRASTAPAAERDPARGPAGVVQRTIHEFKQGRWQLSERGTRGGHQPPADGKEGEFFNDITGKRGDSFASVREGLVDRMMQSGGLAELGAVDVGWSALAGKLAAHAKQLPAVTDKATDDRMVDLGSLFLRDTTGTQVEASVRQPRAGIEQSLLEESARFAWQLMQANGQLGYIQSQGWLHGESHVRVDMNYYYNRPMSDTGALGMHKDTGGDNLFVNLVFDNEHKTPATEWTQDRDPIDGDKLKVMQEHYGVPRTMLQDIAAAKQRLGEVSAEGMNDIMGGVMPRHAYVSWVDELVWHSTPTLANRKKYDKSNDYCTCLVALLKGSTVPGLTNAHVSEFLDLLAALSELSDQSVLRTMNFSALRFKGDIALLLQWIDQIPGSDKAKLLREIDHLTGLGTVKVSTRFGNELDTDNEGQSLILHKSTGVAGRGRSNSNPDMLARVKRAAAKQTLRSFIRTWVRIMRGTSK